MNSRFKLTKRKSQPTNEENVFTKNQNTVESLRKDIQELRNKGDYKNADALVDILKFELTRVKCRKNRRNTLLILTMALATTIGFTAYCISLAGGVR